MATIRYDNQSATRNQPVTAELERVLLAAAEAAGIDEVVIFSGGQHAEGEGPRTGSTRHDHGNSADVRLYQNGRRLVSTNNADTPILQAFAQAASANGATGIGAGEGYMDGNMHVGFQGQESYEGVWGDGGRSANAPGWLQQAFNAGRNGTGLVATAGTQAGPRPPMPVGSPGQTPPGTGATHRVRQGDTLTDIANRYGTTANELARLNNISNPDRISAGSNLRIPAAGDAPQAQPSGGSHTVRQGDTLWDIAQRQLGDGNHWQEIAQANGITDPGGIQPGQQLTIPGAGGPSGRNRIQDVTQSLRTGIERFRRARENGSPIGEALQAATGRAKFADERGWNQETGSVLNSAPPPRGSVPDQTPIPRRLPAPPIPQQRPYQAPIQGDHTAYPLLRPGDRPQRVENAADIMGALGGVPSVQAAPGIDLEAQNFPWMPAEEYPVIRTGPGEAPMPMGGPIPRQQVPYAQQGQTRDPTDPTQNDNYIGPNYGEAMAANTQVVPSPPMQRASVSPRSTNPINEANSFAVATGNATPYPIGGAGRTPTPTQQFGTALSPPVTSPQRPPPMVPQTLTPAEQQRILQQMYGF